MGCEGEGGEASLRARRAAAIKQPAKTEWGSKAKMKGDHVTPRFYRDKQTDGPSSGTAGTSRRRRPAKLIFENNSAAAGGQQQGLVDVAQRPLQRAH